MLLPPALAALAAAAGCAPRADAPAAAAAAPARCDAAAAAGFVGRRGDPATIEAARIAAGAATARVLAPGAQATMDYRDDRLDLLLDAAGTIRTLRCG